jgi:hypothetical protein
MEKEVEKGMWGLRIAEGEGGGRGEEEDRC